MAAQGAVEPESLEVVRQFAPVAFRTQERAVTEADYAEVTMRHPEIQRAVATFRWTGSWHTVYITVDRYGGLPVDKDFKNDLRKFIGRYRLAGYDLDIDDPRFVSLDITMNLCVSSDYFRDSVKQSVLRLFSNRLLPDGRRGLFHPDNFTFGQPVYMSPLISAAQQIPGVVSVQVTKFERRGIPDGKAIDDGKLILGRLEIARCDNDLNFPERGSFQLSIRRREMSNIIPPSLRELNPCGCCAGVTASTPNAIANAAGQSAIAYRVGTYSSFKETMVAALSNARNASLQGLGTRTDDDFSISLLDALAVTCHVLTFYQERNTNECYIRTATERRSLLELARLIGYRLRPGVAASTYLAFTVDDSPGAPDQAVKQATIDVGTRVQSIPGPGEKPQTFETIEKIEARPEWNAIRPRLTRRPVVGAHDTVLFLEGIATGLKPGDALVLHPDGDDKPVVTRVRSVITHAAQQRTEVELDPPVALRATPAPTTPSATLKSVILSNVGLATSKYLGKTEAATKFKAAAITERFNTQSVFANLLATRPSPPTVTGVPDSSFYIRA